MNSTATFIQLQHFLDLSKAAQVGVLRSDARIQVKMPTEVVRALDQIFAGKNRSHVLTQLAVDAVIQQLRLKDRAVLKDLSASEQEMLDTAVSYLEERDASR